MVTQNNEKFAKIMKHEYLLRVTFGVLLVDNRRKLDHALS